MTIIIPQLRLIRIEDNHQFGTFGVLTINSETYCVTLEPPEYANKRNIACIPTGQYEMERIVSIKFGTTYEVCNVPDRDDILFHAGNEIKDTEGCILLAEKFGKLKGDRAVLNSGNTFKNFMNDMGYYKKLHLTIIEGW